MYLEMKNIEDHSPRNIFLHHASELHNFFVILNFLESFSWTVYKCVNWILFSMNRKWIIQLQGSSDILGLFSTP